MVMLVDQQHRCWLFDSIVEFATYGDMKNVITKLDDTEINGRRIRIIEQKPRARRQSRFALLDCVCLWCTSLTEWCMKGGSHQCDYWN